MEVDAIHQPSRSQLQLYCATHFSPIWEGTGESRSDRPLDLNLTMQPCLLLLLPFPFLPLPLLSPAARPSVRLSPSSSIYLDFMPRYLFALTNDKEKSGGEGTSSLFPIFGCNYSSSHRPKNRHTFVPSLSHTQQRSNTLPRTRKPNDTKKRQQRAFLTNIFLIYFSFAFCKQSWWAFTLHRDVRPSEYAKKERQKDTIHFALLLPPPLFPLLENHGKKVR